MSTAEQRMAILLRGSPPGSPRPDDEAKPEKKKRGRGRPRKEKLPEPEPEPELSEESVVWREAEEFGMDGVDPMNFRSEEDRKKGAALLTTIQQYKTRLNCKGTGKYFSMHSPIEELEREVEIMQEEMAGRRGDQAIKSFTINMLAPLLEKVIDRLVPKEEFDASGLPQTVDENWLMFQEAATEISIRHRALFSTGPYLEYTQAMVGCAQMTAAKNRLEKMKEEAKDAI